MKKNKKIILASSSPRRKELLEKHNIIFTVEVNDTDEELDSSLSYIKQLEKVAFYKGETIARNNPQAIVISADSMILFNQQLIGKPKSREDAFNTLKSFSNKTHQVITVVCLFEDDKVNYLNETTEVTFKELSDQQINDYLDTDEYLGKAGSYAIQGLGKELVKGINGDLENVIGLPCNKILKYLNN